MNDVQVIPGWSYAGNHYYEVWVNGEKYDEFVSSRRWLSQSQMYDVASYYSEALDMFDSVV